TLLSGLLAGGEVGPVALSLAGLIADTAIASVDRAFAEGDWPRAKRQLAAIAVTLAGPASASEPVIAPALERINRRATAAEAASNAVRSWRQGLWQQAVGQWRDQIDAILGWPETDAAARADWIGPLRGLILGDDGQPGANAILARYSALIQR